MNDANNINNFTPQQKVDFFTTAFSAHCAEYSASVDPHTGECDFSLTFIYDVFIELMRTAYGVVNVPHAVNGARLALDLAGVL